ncbi:hypothetical protein [uncultured Paraglaciecola sp.]|uniref:hypothetical protein n=1 Tax=uncultured Paraglaciecola sp. TaxID=1765024 RepID=UPI00263500F8|nr:hypothetical protein [uncultured Paraglaciecola sp.]
MTALLLVASLFNTTQGEKMSKFNYLEKAKVKPDLVKPYELVDLEINGKCPVLFVTTSSDANRALFRKRLADAQDKPTRKKSKKVTEVDIEKVRTDDIELYAKFVVTDWKDVIDDSGKLVPFSEEACRDYLLSLPSYIIDPMRDYCSDPLNWTDSIDAESVAKK